MRIALSITLPIREYEQRRLSFPNEPLAEQRRYSDRYIHPYPLRILHLPQRVPDSAAQIYPKYTSRKLNQEQHFYIQKHQVSTKLICCFPDLLLKPYFCSVICFLCFTHLTLSCTACGSPVTECASAYCVICLAYGSSFNTVLVPLNLSHTYIPVQLQVVE